MHDFTLAENEQTYQRSWRLQAQPTTMQSWIHPDKYRYYQAELVPDLFGDWSLVRVWGGLGTPRGGYKITGLACYEDGLREIETLDTHRQKRGYVAVESLAHWSAQLEALRLAGLLRAPIRSASKPDPAQLDLLTDAFDGLSHWDGQMPDDFQDKPT